jgi:hypothetical protein
MKGSKVYLQPVGMVINAILDIQEPQRGKTVFTDTSRGIIRFSVRMYASKWEFRFAVADIGKNRCRVELEAEGNLREKKRQVMREFFLLDSMLVGEALVELEEAAQTGETP